MIYRGSSLGKGMPAGSLDDTGGLLSYRALPLKLIIDLDSVLTWSDQTYWQRWALRTLKLTTISVLILCWKCTDNGIFLRK